MTTHEPTHRPRRSRWALAGGVAVGIQLMLASVALGASVPTDPEPDLVCPGAFGDGLVTQYVTTVNTPADSTSWWVSVEFTVADEANADAECEISLASYELPGPDFVFPQTLFDSDTGTFAAGTHTLTVDLPRDGAAAGCFAQYDFVFGPPIANLTFDNRYDDRQIRSRIEGSATCPEGGTQGGTGGPPLPDTSMGARGPISLPLLYALSLLAALVAVGYFNLRAVVAARRR